MASVTSASRYITSASRYHPHFQNRSSMYIRGLIPRNFAESDEAVPIGYVVLISSTTYMPQEKDEFTNVIAPIIFL